MANTFTMYSLFCVTYAMLIPIQIHGAKRLKNRVAKPFQASLLLEFLSFCFISVHVIKSFWFGEGFYEVAVTGDILDILSRTTFMLQLMLLATGSDTKKLETINPNVFRVTLAYGVAYLALYSINTTKIDLDLYIAWPGWMMLGLRTSCVVWFLFQLRKQLFFDDYEKMASDNLFFLLFFRTYALTWLLLAPGLAIAVMNMPSIMRFKIIVGITYYSDSLAFSLIALWPPPKSEIYLNEKEKIPVNGQETIEEIRKINQAKANLTCSNDELMKSLVKLVNVTFSNNWKKLKERLTVEELIPLLEFLMLPMLYLTTLALIINL